MYRQQVGPLRRWRITGFLAVDSPLHVGSGERLLVRQRADGVAGREPAEAEYSAVFTVNNRPAIPGTGFKGALRAWAEQNLGADCQERVNRCFGFVTGNDARAGQVVFSDLVGYQDPPAGGQPIDATRRTCLAVSVVIDPVTRTAMDGLLYQEEYVPPGGRFSLVIDGQQPVEDDDLCGFLLGVLTTASRVGLRLGANTANGWGRCRFDTLQASEMDPARWLAQGCTAMWCTSLVPRPVQATRVALRIAERLEVRIRIKFDGPVLVRDHNAADGASNKLRMMRRNNAPYLPASSVRGVLRAQAARIWRTIADGDNGIPLESSVAADNPEILHPFFKLWGTAGWRSPIGVSDFHLVPDDNSEPYDQTLVSIDRFTGGSANQHLFTASTWYGPTFEGTVTIDLRRMRRAGVGGWAIVLAMYLARDLSEGDVTVGGWSARGFGLCRWIMRPVRELVAMAAPGIEYQLFELNLIDWAAELEVLANNA
jgi:CRISPR/Cas system CSM-associated protein Csm3 (group 7 of RAMP superfamily)